MPHVHETERGALVGAVLFAVLLGVILAGAVACVPHGRAKLGIAYETQQTHTIALQDAHRENGENVPNNLCTCATGRHLSALHECAYPSHTP